MNHVTLLHLGCDTSDGWKEYKGHCFKLINNLDGEGRDFFITQKLCAESGVRHPQNGAPLTSLVEGINSLADNHFIADTVAGGQRAWIGAIRTGDGKLYSIPTGFEPPRHIINVYVLGGKGVRI